MSCSEGHKGKLIPTGLGLRDLIKQRGIVLPTYYTLEEDESEIYWSLYDITGEYIMVGDMAYEIQDKDYDDCYREDATVNADGSIDYDVYFYNGGCSFEEALNHAVSKAKEEGTVKSLPELTTLYVFEQALELREKSGGEPFNTKSELDGYLGIQSTSTFTLAYLLGKGHTQQEWDAYGANVVNSDVEFAFKTLTQKLGLEG